MKFEFSVFLALASVSAFSLHIKYDNQPITSQSQYESFLNAINGDPRCVNYIAIRDRIARCTTIEGPLISPNRGVLGAHHVGFHFNNGHDSEISQTTGFNNEQFIFGDTYKMPGTDLAFPRFDEVNRTYDSQRTQLLSRAYKPVTEIPILERASIDEIRDSKNSFYAFSNTLHGDNILNSQSDRFTFMDFKYRNVVKCKPTLDDPSVQRTLRFDIDDAANLPMEFRTSHGDSVQPFFMMTANNRLKVVGTHNPGGDHFSVENIAYPTTEAFIDRLIQKDIEINNLARQGVMNPVDIVINTGSPIFDESNGIAKSPVPEPFSVLTIGMGVGALIRNHRKNKK